MNSVANYYVEKLKKNATKAELKFYEIVSRKKLNLKFQYRIDILDANARIKQFFIVDFCDVKNKIIFEIDGDYHNSPEQIKKDLYRTKLLNKLGYRVFRVSNADVFVGKTTQLLYAAYLKLT